MKLIQFRSLGWIAAFLILSMAWADGALSSDVEIANSGPNVTVLEPNDSRVSEEFAAQGLMHKFDRFILSAPATYRMNYKEAREFCAGMGAHLPSLEEWKEIAAAHIVIPDRYWSSLHSDKKRAYSFHSQSHKARSSLQITKYSAHCVATPIVDLVMIGAGPVGLYTAIQAKLHDPKLRVLMYEKHPTYLRNHPVKLKRNIFTRAHSDADFQMILQGLGTRASISEIEGQFKDFAIRLGIDIVYQSMTLATAMQAHRHARVFIGSDGAHSKVRSELVAESKMYSDVLKHVVEVKYQVQNRDGNRVRPLSALASSWSLSKVNHTVTEFIGRPRPAPSTSSPSDSSGSEAAAAAADDSILVLPPSRASSGNGMITPVTLRILISSDEYATLKDKVSFGNPILWNNGDSSQPLPAALKETIGKWLQIRADIAEEQAIPESIKITAIPLGEYYSPKVYRSIEGKHFFLVGDSAFGVPFFKSINNGFECGNVLARVLASLFDANLKFEKVDSPYNKHFNSVTGLKPFRRINQSQPKDYENFVRKLQNREWVVAHAKSHYVTTLQTVVYSMQVTADTSRFASRPLSKTAKGLRGLLGVSSDSDADASSKAVHAEEETEH